MSTDIPNESWLGPFVASLAPYVVQAVRTADSSDGWRALDGTGFDAEHIRGSLLESACNMVIATVTLTLDGALTESWPCLPVSSNLVNHANLLY